MGKRILFFDDEDDVRTSIEMILNKPGYTSKGYANGRNILSLINDFKPDLILLDILLGYEDGRDICKTIKQNSATAHIPVIIVSGVPEIYNTIANAGANDIVLKPFDESTLLRRIERQFLNAAG